MSDTSDTPDMPTRGHVRQKLKQVIFRHLQREIRDALKRVPESCGYNQSMSVQKLGPVRICNYKVDGEPRRTLCDSRVYNGVQRAAKCPLWEPKRDKDAIKADFRRFIESGDRGLIAQRYPDVAALMWVLDGKGYGDLMVEVESDPLLDEDPEGK